MKPELWVIVETKEDKPFVYKFPIETSWSWGGTAGKLRIDGVSLGKEGKAIAWFDGNRVIAIGSSELFEQTGVGNAK